MKSAAGPSATRRVLLAGAGGIALGTALGACASKPVPSGKPLVRKIALVPATEPLALTLENRSAVMYAFPIASLGYWSNSKAKARVFNEAMATRPPVLAPKLTSTVVDALRGAGYRIEPVDGLRRDPEDPDKLDLEKVPTDAEAVLHLRINEVGLFSSPFSADYVPRVNVEASFYVRSIDDTIYDEALYYGVDAKDGKPWAIVVDPKFTYATFDVVIARQDELREVFESATLALAQVIARQLLAAIAAKVRYEP